MSTKFDRAGPGITKVVLVAGCCGLQHLECKQRSETTSFQLHRFHLQCLRNVLAAVIMLFNDEILDEDEMFCLFSELNRKNPPFPYWNYDRRNQIRV